MDITEVLEHHGVSKNLQQVFRHYDAGLTQRQIAKIMGITPSAICQKLQTLRRRFPDLLPNIDTPKTLSYNPDMDDGSIKEKF